MPGRLATEKRLPPKANAKRIPSHRPVVRLGVLMALVFAGLLAALLSYGIKDRLGRRHHIAASRYAADAERALLEYRVDHRQFPPGDNKAMTLALTGENAIQKDYFAGKRRDLLDDVMRCAYGHPLTIRFQGSKVVAISSGPDGIPGNDDDIDSTAYRALKPYPPLPDPIPLPESTEQEE